MIEPAPLQSPRTMSADRNANRWGHCRFLTCSILPVRHACNLSCPFCFSKSSISALRHDSIDWSPDSIAGYLQFAKERGATRLVITGGGEPLLRAEAVVQLVRLGTEWFDEIACFTNGTYLTPQLAKRLADAGLSYLCYSRHHDDDTRCRELMGATVPSLQEFFAAAAPLRVRATCVMARGFIDSVESVDRYMTTLSKFGVSEFTFKHTYVAYERSFFGNSQENAWARRHQIECDPFVDRGHVLATLPWGPQIRRIDPFQVCYYYEPDPGWEKEHRLCRSVNLLSNGDVYASLEDQQSLLYRLKRC